MARERSEPKNTRALPRDLQSALLEADDRLTDSDRRLAAALLADPAQASYISANEAARLGGVHPTSAVRFARKLGYENYSDLRAHMRSKIMQTPVVSAQRMRARLQQAQHAGSLHSVVEGDVRALQQIPTQVSEQQITQLTQLIMQAPSILIVGLGHAGMLARYFSLRLRRSSYPAIGLDRIDWRCEDELALAKKDSLLLCIVFRKVDKPIEALMTKARSLGIRVAVITDLMQLRPKPDLALAANRGSEGESQSLAVPMALCNAVILDLARKDEGRSMNALEQLAAIRKK
jgi:DNA-binding MurR/RpiR family transcriptional regulator